MKIEKQSLPLVSIILPVYNRKDILKRTLDSLLKQTFKNYELIIVDDGSEDKIEETIFPYLKKYQNFKYFRHSNRGLALSRNIGILIAQGIYITFIDSDDEYKVNHLKKMVNFIRNNPDVDFIHSFPDIVSDEKDVWLPSAIDKTKLIHVNDCVYGGTFFAKREVFISLGGFKDIYLGGDYDFYRRLVGKFKICKLNEKTYIYYRNIKNSICNDVKTHNF